MDASSNISKKLLETKGLAIYNEGGSWMSETNINGKNKDRLFKFIFGREENKKWALSLYNAMNGTDYVDPDEVEINTIEDVVYMGMRNDVSFIIRDDMNIYEHQSTICPNIPVRELMYAGHLYDKYIKSHRLNIYGRRQVMLPIPKLVVFYNGTDDAGDDMELNLSSAFDPARGNEADISVRVRMININYGHNPELLAACKALNDYSWFVSEVRYNCRTMDIEDAVGKAIDDMDGDAELKTFLVGNRSEVVMSCLTEYDEEATMQAFADEAREEGREEGEDFRLIDQIYKKVQKGKDVNLIADEVEESEEVVRPIVDIILTLDPESRDIKNIYSIWQSKKK